ncbi:MAG TPA: twin-arginine translocation signal domain-containing protein [Hyphomicrobiaceae bacterium]|jgi:hypothetical protein
MRTRTRRRLLVGLAIATGLGIIGAANAHLVWASLKSQPECVPHVKAPGHNGQFRAAKSSC